MSLVPDTRSPQQPPLSPSPSHDDEDDLGWRDPCYNSDDELDPQGVTTAKRSQHTKGKTKATEYLSRPSTSYANGGSDEVSQLSGPSGSAEEYPPTTEEEADSRRVLENLRRWEIAERQRWKAARESTSIPASIVADVARRATSVWSRRTSHLAVDGGGRHHALQTSEDSAHMDDVAPSPLPSPAPSRTPTPSPDHPYTGPHTRDKDPFSDPHNSTSSLFVNAQPLTSDIGTSASFTELEAPGSGSSSYSPKGSRPVSVPAPLDLPKPRSPPPRTPTPHVNRPPEPFPRPDSRMSRASSCDEEDEKPARWWTDWLCGCSEGPDRGGEVQAGRTNPLE